MSCSHLIRSYTNSKYIYRGVTRFRSSFICGRCSGCISKNRTDWRVRSYYESLDCLQNNGFILFDTLTYSDAHIKRYSDVFPDMDIPNILNHTSFSRHDVQTFFKRLRINLKRDGFDYEPEELRYILTSEYGSDEKKRGFQLTHRPHYHVLFFVRFDIDPLEFSRHVSRAWYCGKTDGVRPGSCEDCPVRSFCKGVCLYQSSDYVTNERVISFNSEKNLIKCVNYVTKYVSKDLFLTSKLQDRVDQLFSVVMPDYLQDIQKYRIYRRFCSQVLPFHLQSRFFGLTLLDDVGARQRAIDYSSVILPTGETDVVKEVALPRYYQVHLYYEWHKVDGRTKWNLTPFGVDSKVRQLSRKIRSFMTDYRSFDSTLSSDTLFQLSLYKNVYQGTLSDVQSLLLPYQQYYRRMLVPHADDEQPLYYNRNTKVDSLTIGRFLSPSYSVTADGEVIYKGKQLHHEFIPFDGYKVVTDKVCPFWHGFDRKLAAYDRWKKMQSASRDLQMLKKDMDTDYYRQLGLLQK